MLQLYSNENFPIAMVNLLRASGHNVLTSYESGQANQSIPDDQGLRHATANNRILITENRQDFLDLHRATNHAGIIICKADRDYVGKVTTINEFIERDARPLENRLLRLLKQNLKGFGQAFTIQEYSKS
jgi:Domain of unknown function (DUF5615)